MNNKRKLEQNEAASVWTQRTVATDSNGKAVAETERQCNFADGSMDAIVESAVEIANRLGLDPGEVSSSLAENDVWTNGKVTVRTERWMNEESEPV